MSPLRSGRVLVCVCVCVCVCVSGGLGGWEGWWWLRWRWKGVTGGRGAAAMATHIRVKREKTTYFLSTEAAETVLELKEKLQVLCGVSVDKQRLQLENGSVLEDASTVGDLKLETDCIVALTYAKGAPCAARARRMQGAAPRVRASLLRAVACHTSTRAVRSGDG